MKIKSPNRKSYTIAHKRNCQKVADHVATHYPKDKALHKWVRAMFKSMDQSVSKLEKAKPKSTRRRTTKRIRRTTGRRTIKRSAPKRRRVMKRTARRSTPRRVKGQRRTRRTIRRRRSA
jgi:hypothetical protein